MATCSSIWIWVTLIMVVAQMNSGFANVAYKIAADLGGSLRVIVAYRMIFVAIFFLPCVYLYERCQPRRSSENEAPNPSLTKTVVGLILTSSFLGQEQLAVSTWAGRAKIAGTIIAISGAMIISLYKGPSFHIVPRSLHTGATEADLGPYQKVFSKAIPRKNEGVGIALTLAGCLCSSIALLIDDIILRKYPDPLRVNAIKAAFTAVQCTAYAVLMDCRDSYKWRVEFMPRGVIIVYTALISLGVMSVLTSWCVAKKGAFIVAAFSPITLVAVMLGGPFLFSGQPLQLGSVIGVAVITIGIYLIVWGKMGDNEDDPDPATVDPPTELNHLSQSVYSDPVSSPSSVMLSFPPTPPPDPIEIEVVPSNDSPISVHIDPLPSSGSTALTYAPTPPAPFVEVQSSMKRGRSADSYFEASWVEWKKRNRRMKVREWERKGSFRLGENRIEKSMSDVSIALELGRLDDTLLDI